MPGSDTTWWRSCVYESALAVRSLWEAAMPLVPYLLAQSSRYFPMSPTDDAAKTS